MNAYSQSQRGAADHRGLQHQLLHAQYMCDDGPVAAVRVMQHERRLRRRIDLGLPSRLTRSNNKKISDHGALQQRMACCSIGSTEKKKKKQKKNEMSNEAVSIATDCIAAVTRRAQRAVP